MTVPCLLPWKTKVSRRLRGGKTINPLVRRLFYSSSIVPAYSYTYNISL